MRNRRDTKPRTTRGKSGKAKGQRGAARESSIPDFRTGAEFDALSDAEKERVWESYNRPVALSETRPLTAAQRKQWQAARGPGRPRKGKGAARINVTVERGLLGRADAYAGARGLSRAELIARGLELAIGGGE